MTTLLLPSWQSERPIGHNPVMRRALPLVLLALFFCLPGCSHNEALIPRRMKFYRSIVSLSPGTTEIVEVNGDSSTLRGRTAADNYPPNMTGSIQVVANVKPDYEAIAQIRPDLIIYDKALYNDQDIAKLKGTGAELFAIDAQSVDDFIKQLYVLGSMIGWETRMDTYIQNIQNSESTAKADPYSPTPKVAIVLADPTGDLICGADTFLGDVVKIAGGEIIGPKGSQFLPLNAEEFVADNPDVIITGGTKVGTVVNVESRDLLMKDPRFKTISAIKTGRVIAIDADVLERRGTRVDKLIDGIHAAIGPAK